MESTLQFQPGDLVRVRGREWVVLPELRKDVLRLRPLGGAECDATLVYLPIEPEAPVPARFAYPDPKRHGTLADAELLFDAVRLKLRAGAGPFRSFGNLNFEPRIYQLVPLLMALKLDPVRLLIADDVGIGKTIEAGLIVRELIDRGEIESLSVICPPHLCDQWQRELNSKFGIDAVVVRTGTAARLERELLPGESIFEAYPFTIVSLDYVKSDRRYHDFVVRCPPFVIVDEAHTCVSSNPKARHQRHRLIQALSRDDSRGMLLLTATPHSGDDVAFHNLLALINRKFEPLQTLEDTAERKQLRRQLAGHFVQRRRGDVAKLQDMPFPIRERSEATYRLSGAWHRLFADVIAYAREMVTAAEDGTKQQQRMSWWAALALMRCASSSPAAALAALRTRLRAPEGATEKTRIRRLDRGASKTVMDSVGTYDLSESDVVPAGALRVLDDDATLRELIGRAEQLHGIRQDPKIKMLVREIKNLIQCGYCPVVFCRYIATAHYVGAQLRRALPKKSTHLDVVTGELTSDQREERVEELGLHIHKKVTPVLVATDCLSEGINLQQYFNAVVHYDLTWNPTRHEQREGRVDRFGQPYGVVRALMLYGENNPVDGAVLQVIVRKAEIIRKELGVAVPLPGDSKKLLDTIMRAALYKGTQLEMEFGEVDDEADRKWKQAKELTSRTLFAQRRLKPQDAIVEWKATEAALGGTDDVVRFVTGAAERLRAPLASSSRYRRLPAKHLPDPLRDQLRTIGIDSKSRFTFHLPAPAGVAHIHRSHALVSTIADYVAEQALNGSETEIGARSSAIVTTRVSTRTTLYALRLRSQISVDKYVERGRYRPMKTLVAEECVCVEVMGTRGPEVLTVDEAMKRFRWQPAGNLPEGRKQHLVRQAVDALEDLQPSLNGIARSRAKALQEDHRRVRQASNTTGLRYRVTPSLPVDVLGVFVFTPVVRFA